MFGCLDVWLPWPAFGVFLGPGYWMDLELLPYACIQITLNPRSLPRICWSILLFLDFLYTRLRFLLWSGNLDQSEAPSAAHAQFLTNHSTELKHKIQGIPMAPVDPVEPLELLKIYTRCFDFCMVFQTFGTQICFHSHFFSSNKEQLALND